MGFGGSPQAPAPPPPPPAPAQPADTAGGASGAVKQQAAANAGMGFGGTLATSPQGLLAQAPTAKTELGQ